MSVSRRELMKGALAAILYPSVSGPIMDPVLGQPTHIHGPEILIDWVGSIRQAIILEQDCSLIFGEPEKCAVCNLFITQGKGGNNVITWPPNVRWPNSIAPILTPSVDAHDIASFYFDGSNWYGMMSLNLK